MRKIYIDVLAFHEKHGCHIGEVPAVPDHGTVELRRKLIQDEVNEMLEAMKNEDLRQIAGGIFDSIYVLVGTAVSYGIHCLPEIWNASHKAYMEPNCKDLEPVIAELLKRCELKYRHMEKIKNRRNNENGVNNGIE